MLVSEFLERAFSHIDSREKWIQKNAYKFEYFREVSIDTWERKRNPKPIAACSVGAIDWALKDCLGIKNFDRITIGRSAYENGVAESALKMLAIAAGTKHSIPEWNDNNDYETVVAGWQKAIRMAKEREAVELEVQEPALV